MIIKLALTAFAAVALTYWAIAGDRPRYDDGIPYQALRVSLNGETYRPRWVISHDDGTRLEEVVLDERPIPKRAFIIWIPEGRFGVIHEDSPVRRISRL